MPMEQISLADYDYALPEDRIAQRPAVERDHARLIICDRGAIVHAAFPDIVDFLNSADCLVLNRTKVIPARLMGRRATGGKTEVFLLQQTDANEWITIGRPGRNLRTGARLFFDHDITAEVLDDSLAEGKRLMRFSASREELFSIGAVPLPPYIRRDADALDRERYQTVFAQTEGSSAAPTAGLHFTEALLNRIRAKGVSLAYVTLHVGLGTFRPITVERVEEHAMEKEAYAIDKEACDTINRTMRQGGRVVAVGTTVAKTLETAALACFPLAPAAGASDLFIRPGFTFRVVNALVTNFHMPRSTLLLLVAAFAGKENLFSLYTEALKRQYRFLSYGDATLFIA